MRVLIDITHPAHVHFFKFPITLLKKNGHQVLITSREKEVTHELLDKLGMEHISLSTQAKGGALSLGKELLLRNLKLYKVTREFKPDIMAAIGGIFISHIGFVTRIPSLVFYDTENAILQNFLTYPFASRIIVPRCYQGGLPEKKQFRYAGYHELSYLHPDYFTPDKQKAIENGLAQDKKTYLIRLVSWKASHDIGEKGWNLELLDKVIETLTKDGKVIISSEKKLPAKYASYIYKGIPSEIHHLMAYCHALIGESATMASECAVLGVPAVYVAETGRGYTDEQEELYGLVCNVKILDWEHIEPGIYWATEYSRQKAATSRTRLLQSTIDVSKLVVDLIESFPDIRTGILYQ